MLHFCRFIATHHSYMLLLDLTTQIYSTNVNLHHRPLVYTLPPPRYLPPPLPHRRIPIPHHRNSILRKQCLEIRIRAR
jgi:hypothetical protein